MIASVLIVIASIAVGLLVGRHVRKRGANKAMRNLGAVASGLLTLLLGVLIFGSQAPAPQASAVAEAQAAPVPAVSVAAAPPAVQAPHYTAVDADSAAAAKRYIAEVDLAIDRSAALSPDAPLKTLAGFSHRFGDLADQGTTQFGVMGDRLGACGVAGLAAKTLWHARLMSHEPTGADVEKIQWAARNYQDQRGYCLALFKR